MKTSMKLFATLCVAAVLAAPATAALPDQPALLPASGDHGSYATRDSSIPYDGTQDPDLAKSYDNFSISSDYIIDGLCWTGIFAEAIPDPASDVDFIVEIWNVDAMNSNLPDITGGPVLTWMLDGGAAGATGPDVTVTALGHVSPATATTIGGGPAYSYEADLTSATLAAGDYWISILANQAFDHPTEFDPEWQWHLGDGPGDGFSSFDRTLMPPGTLQSGILQEGKDLAFTLKGQLVPEPSSMLMAGFAFISLGLLRRKRK